MIFERSSAYFNVNLVIYDVDHWLQQLFIDKL